MTTLKPDRFLITGIPGTGKTTFGDKFATDFGFVHYDLEDQQTLNRLTTFTQFISELLSLKKSAVITWGFNPEDPPSLELIRQLRNAGFKMIWFAGNRSAALQAFRERGTVSEQTLVAQMERIERSKIVERLKPTIINPMDENGRFKSPGDLLVEIRRA